MKKNLPRKTDDTTMCVPPLLSPKVTEIAFTDAHTQSQSTL